MRKFRHFIKNTIFEALANRNKFKDHYQQAMEEIVALGITPQQMTVLKKYGLLAKDNVTGFYEGRSGDARYQTLMKAIQHVKQTGEQAYYVEMDLQNLGGINAAKGHTGANEVYTAIAGAIKKYLQPVASEVAFFRHGGDEMSAIMVDTTEQAVIMAFEKVKQEVAQIAQKHGVHDIPHAKDAIKNPKGTGVHYGIADITPADEKNPKAIFEEADQALELNKKGAMNVAGNQTMQAQPNAPKGQTGGTASGPPQGA
jgi:diguanylate cyclase (GGDEF)-like protein